MSDMIFYFNPMSRARVAHWMLEEVGAKYDLKFIDWKTNQQKSPEFLRVNPMGKLPTLVHKGTVITENIAICAYLADAFPEKNLAPALSDPNRGTYYRWLFFIVNCFEAAVADRNNPRKEKVPEMALGYGTFETTMKTLEDAVRTNYLCGNQFTAADLYLSSVIAWFTFQKMLEPNPVLMEYVKRCTDRPSNHRANELAQKLMNS